LARLSRIDALVTDDWVMAPLSEPEAPGTSGRSATTDNLSGSSVEELLRAETDNRAWSKTLRQRSSELLNSRLAKAISFEEYTVFRQQANEDAAECKRHGTTLSDELLRRDRRYLQKSNLDNELSPEIDIHSEI
jgi:hypothetical protein